MSDLATWLLAQYDADELVARLALRLDREGVPKALGGPAVLLDKAVRDHIARHDPAAVLADLAAKRRIVELHRHEAKGAGPVLYDGSRDSNEGVFGCVICSCVTDDPGWHLTGGWCDTLRLLALPYTGRDGYDPTWAPSS